ncbi:hypothetical protein JZ751_016672 [Albula glossodonta]|uniref:Small monomeric GTPase n=1 Tax=Albula glossodonta TaxID=121402 RepID=A0A8T2MI98_9TELE|nr:hypothetical protein JZ751_016672 [Albula glossodonta]
MFRRTRQPNPDSDKRSPCDGMTLSPAPPLRRGSTPVPIKHQLRREEAVTDDSDWTPGLEELSSPPISFSCGQEEAGVRKRDGRQGAPFRIVLLGQNGDLSALHCEVCVLVFSVTDRRSFHRTAQLRLLLRETQPQTPIILVGNKSDLVRSREVSTEEAESSALLFGCQYLELSVSLEHHTADLLEGVVRVARGQPVWPCGGAGSHGGARRESLTTRAKRFLSSLVPKHPRERERGRGPRVYRQKSRSCHDLTAL